MGITDRDRHWLRRTVELARTAKEAGDAPYGSVLVDADGIELFADRNRISGGDHTRHPEFAIARWAAENLSPAGRAGATVYTSGEHCPMCTAAHGWVGLGRIVYVASAAQVAQWREELDLPIPPVAPLPVTDIVPGAVVDGPDPDLVGQVRELFALG